MDIYCFDCEKAFSTQSSLNRHKRVVHKKNCVEPREYDKDYGLFKCLSGCNISFKYNMDLRNHLEQEHEFPTEVKEEKFGSYEEFQIWLRNEEKNNDVRYLKSTGTRKTRNGKLCERYYFNCVRSGKERKVSEETRKRALKKQGSSKINTNCTSQIIVNTDNGEFLMTYFKNHYGHEHDIEHLRLSKVTREEIASELRMGVSSKPIVDSIKYINPQLKRDDIVTKYDIKNIKNRYNIHLKDGHRHKNDRKVDLWIKELVESPQNPILFYKKQTDDSVVYEGLDSDDFCLIWMDDVQSDYLKKFGKNVICIDRTHGLNPHDFDLTTIFVIDEFGKGLPTSFMLSDRNDSYIHEIFFRKVKDVVGKLNAKVLMTDMTNACCDAWQKIMGPVKVELFSIWHINREWQQDLSKITESDSSEWAYKTIKYLQATCAWRQNLIHINDSDSRNCLNKTLKYLEKTLDRKESLVDEIQSLANKILIDSKDKSHSTDDLQCILKHLQAAAEMSSREDSLKLPAAAIDARPDDPENDHSYTWSQPAHRDCNTPNHIEYIYI